VLAPAKTLGDMGRVVFNDYLDATLAVVFVRCRVDAVLRGDQHPQSRWARRPAPPRGGTGRPGRERAMTGCGTLYGWARQTARLMIGVPDTKTTSGIGRRFIRASRS